VERVNVTNTVIVNRTYITNVYNNRVTNVRYRNRAVPGAVTAVSRTTFTSAEHVGRHAVRIDEREITRVRATGMAPQIQPGRQSLLGVSEAARRNVRTPPSALVNRQVVAKRSPPPTAAPLVRTVRDPAAGRALADRERLQDRFDRPDRNEAAGRNRSNTGSDAREAINAQDERPPQAILRTDRTQRTDRPAIPDHINRAPRNDAQTAADRLQREQRQSQTNQAGDERATTRSEWIERRRQAQADQQGRDQAQIDQQRRQQAQVDQQRHEQIQREQARMDQQRREQAQADQQRLEQVQRQQAQMDQQRRQQAQVDQQRREAQDRSRMERYSRPEPQRQVEQSRPQPQRQAEPSRPPPQDRERRRPDRNTREP
jgi:hypothetical protein